MSLVRRLEQARQAAGVSAAVPRYIPLVRQHVATPEHEVRAGSSVSQSPLNGTVTEANVPLVAPGVLSSPVSLVRRLHLQRQSLNSPVDVDILLHRAPRLASLEGDRSHCPQVHLGKRRSRGGPRWSQTTAHSDSGTDSASGSSGLDSAQDAELSELLADSAPDVQ